MSLSTDAPRVEVVGAPQMLLIHMGQDEPALSERLRGLTKAGYALSIVPVTDWNRDLSPWPAPAVFGSDAFGGGAEATLRELLKLCADGDKTYILGGYSLAGLFALWAAYRTDRFAAVAAASPSVWFPGFTEFAESGAILCRYVYLSLGDKEEKTRNPVMATVGDRIRGLHAALGSKGVSCVLEWNAGNHFKDADIRTAKAFARTLNAAGL